MSSYWQRAKREAKRRARYSGYCWVWSNPEVDWSQPYLFYESANGERPTGVPCYATRYGDGPPPPPNEEEETLEKRVIALEMKVENLERQLENRDG